MSFAQFVTSAKILLAIIGLVFLASCDGDNPTVPAQPEEGATPTFENIWPAVAGNHWTFGISSNPVAAAEEIWSTPDEVPAVPEMVTLYTALQSMGSTASEETERGAFHLKFVEDISLDIDTAVWRMENHIESTGGSLYPPSPLWLGQLWNRSAARISYTVVDFLGWLHLEGSLSVGHEFSTEIPALVPTQLNGRIWRSLSCSSLGTTYTKCVECFYVLDMGIQPVLNANNEVQGYYRPYSYGVVVYAPKLGPISSHEMIMMAPGQWDNRVASLETFTVEAK